MRRAVLARLALGGICACLVALACAPYHPEGGVAVNPDAESTPAPESVPTVAVEPTANSAPTQQVAPTQPPAPTQAPPTQVAPTAAAVTAVPTTAAQAQAAQAPDASPLFEHVAYFLLHDIQQRRAERAADDPTYWHRVDPTLNDGRVNVLLFGYGETHEPPVTERAFIGSYTLVSYEKATGEVDLVSLTHDIRAPEVEQALQATQSTPVGPIKIDQAYSVGGFPLMRKTIEDATGLAVDATVAFDDAAIAGFVDQVLGGLDVDVPAAFQTNPFYLGGVKYPTGGFPAGPQHLSGLQVIQFIKTVPVEVTYDKRLEHNARKHRVLSALMDALHPAGDPTQVARTALFLNNALSAGTIAFDFDAHAMIGDSIGGLLGGNDEHAPLPHVANTVYVVDPDSGDGGVEWVNANQATNPATRRDLAEHKYGDLAMEVPFHGDPDAPDLVNHYWTDVRDLVRYRLSTHVQAKTTRSQAKAPQSP